MEVHACNPSNPSILEAETGGSPTQEKPGLHSGPYLKKRKKRGSLYTDVTPTSLVEEKEETKQVNMITFYIKLTLKP
jgi:hypothetical protein